METYFVQFKDPKKAAQAGVGRAISLHVQQEVIPASSPEAQPQLKLTSYVAVLWDHLRSPAPSFHRPDELEHLHEEEVLSEEEEEEEELESAQDRSDDERPVTEEAP